MLIRSSIGVLILAAAAVAQPPGPPGPRGRFGPGPGPEPGRGGARLMGAEAGMPGRVVKGAPFSADIVTETTQSLQDGNRVHQTNTVKMYRDSEGRTRSEQSLKTLNGLAPNANLPSVVFINDPVAGANYALNTSEKTATRSTWSRPGPPLDGQARPMGRGPGRPASPEVAIGDANGRGLRRGQNSNIKTESLGSQMFEGVQADGTRTTMTIPAGQIGNELPISVVSETWYSKELKMVVMSKRSDPRMGETITRMTNVSRSDPPTTMFQVPVDYKTSDVTRGRGGPGSRQ